LHDIYSFVGQRIRAERKARKLTLEELASAAGMNTSFLHQIETAKKKPSLRMVQSIADALQVPIHRLFEGAKKADAPDPFVGKLASIVKDADATRRKTIFKVVKALASDKKSGA
jgi:transcriptional regulator with XRE-family HTH domain